MSEPTKGSLDVFGAAEWGKAAQTFIEKVSHHVDRWSEPRHIVRIAKAEAEATLIRARAENGRLAIEVQGDIAVTELRRRAANRVLAEATEKQARIEEVVRDAVPLIDEKSAKPEKMDDEFIENLFEKIKPASFERMRKLWTHILAREANQPGSFSMRAVNTLASMDKHEAESLLRLCNFCFKGQGLAPAPVVFSWDADIYTKNGVTFDAMVNLESIGLVQIAQGLTSIGVEHEGRLVVAYFNTRTILEVPKKRMVSFGKVRLNPVGQQLLTILNISPVPGFRDYAITQWEKVGIKCIRLESAPMVHSASTS
jgi:hypothetical protein